MLAVFVLLARLLGTGGPAASAQAAPVGFTGLDGVAICHGSGASEVPADQHPSKLPGHDHACLLCPACAVAAPAMLPPFSDVPRRVLVMTGHVALPPPSTGPPHAVRAATPPTGPPARPV